MPNQLYPKYRQVALEGLVAWLTDNIKAVLVDFDTYGKAITAVTNATPAVVTSTAHGFSNGDSLVIAKVGGSTGINNIATSGNLASKTSNQAPYYGVADAADVTWTAVSGAQSEVVVVYKDTGTAGTSNLIAFIDQATNLPVTPNGGDITVSFDNGANRIFAL